MSLSPDVQHALDVIARSDTEARRAHIAAIRSEMQEQVRVEVERARQEREARMLCHERHGHFPDTAIARITCPKCNGDSRRPMGVSR